MKDVLVEMEESVQNTKTGLLHVLAPHISKVFCVNKEVHSTNVMPNGP